MQHCTAARRTTARHALSTQRAIRFCLLSCFIGLASSFLVACGNSGPSLAFKRTPGPLTVTRTYSAQIDTSTQESNNWFVSNEPKAEEAFRVELPESIYTVDGRHGVTVLLLDGEPEAPKRAAIIKLLWLPEGGKTPVDPNATNTSIKYVDFRDESKPVVLTGAGFSYPLTKLDGPKLTMDLWEIDLLPDSPEDRKLTGTQRAQTVLRLQGRINANRDDRRAQRQIQAVQAAIAQKLGGAYVSDPSLE